MKLLVQILFIAILFVSSEAACSPGQVSNVTLYSNYSLYWSAVDNPNKCTITNYIIEVQDDEDGTVFLVETSQTTLYYRFTFLDMCKSYTFKVQALSSDFVLGPSESYRVTTQPLSTANLTLANVTLDDDYTVEDEIEISWELANEEVSRCVTSYRVVYWDERNDAKDQFVYENKFAFKEEAACRNYTVQVSAIIGNPDIEGPKFNLEVTGHYKVPEVPTSEDSYTSSNEATMVWKLQPYSENLCTLLALNVYTLGAPGDETEVHVPIEDNLLRPDVVVTLTGLSANTVYVSYVNVENVAGTSKNVTIRYQTTDGNGNVGTIL